MKVRALRLAAFAVALGLADSTWSASAVAAPTTESEQLLSQGIQLRRRHEDAAALEAFRRVYEIDPSGRTLAQIALAEQALGRWLEAERHLGDALHGERDPWIARNKEALIEALADVSHHVGQVDIEANVAGAELFLDDKPVGALPLKRLHLAAGKTTLELRAPGYEVTRFDVDVPAGGVLQARVELRRVPSAVDAHSRAPDPVGAPPPPPITGPSRDGSTGRTVAFVMLGTGGLLLAGGGIANVLRERALSKYDDDSLCFYPPLSRDQRCGQYAHDASTAGTVMALGYALGGVTVGASIVLLLASPGKRAPSSAVTMEPLRGGAAFSYAGSF